MLLKSFEMDARRAGIAQGRSEGIAQGRSEGIAQGFADGIMQTAKKLLEIGVAVESIVNATGLSREEIEKL